MIHTHTLAGGGVRVGCGGVDGGGWRWLGVEVLVGEKH